MTRNAGEVEQAVSRTLRDSLERLQRTTEELNQAVSDLVSACGSARPSNSLPPMLRAQTSAASLAASLDVLARFVTAALQPGLRTAAEQEAVAIAEEQESPHELPEPPVISEPMLESQPEEPLEVLQASNMEEEGAPVTPSVTLDEPPQFAPQIELQQETPADLSPELPPQVPAFEIASLPQPEQDLHRRASRVAKVSMQDIKMLRPNEVLLGKENKDICRRLRDDIEKAHKEYDRRFQSILGHPVDYFYDWMVEILGDGNPEALGEYPYPSPVLRR